MRQITPDQLRAWHVERLQNCERLAKTTTGAERDRMRDYVDYFSATIMLIDWIKARA